MDKNKLINEIVELETDWIKEMAVLFEYEDVEGLLEAQLHTEDEWKEAIDINGIESAIIYRDAIKKILKEAKENTEFRESLLEEFKEEGLSLDTVPKQPLI